MKLPFLSVFKKQEPKEYFLAFLLRDEQVHAVVFEEAGQRIQVIGQGKKLLSGSIETLSQEELLQAADKAISAAEESLPDSIRTHKTVFGVKEAWVDDNHITKTYLTRLKAMSDELDLQPIGFLVFPEAIAHLLQREEGAPISGILIDTGRKQVSITLIRAGRIIETKEVPVEESPTVTVENALKKFENVEIFPSRLILFDNGDKSIEGKFVSHHWSKSLPFLHVPQVTTLPSDFDTRAILYGTATQMGFDAIDLVKQAHVRSFAEDLGQEEVTQVDQTEQNDRGRLLDKRGDNYEQVEQDSPEESEKIEPVEKTPYLNEEKPDELSSEKSSGYFGFVKDADIAKEETPHASSPFSGKEMDEVTSEIPEEVKEEETPANAAFGFSASGPTFVQGAKQSFGQMKNVLPKNFSPRSMRVSFAKIFQGIGLPGGKALSTGNKFVFIIPTVILLLLIGVLWYLFGLHATVVLSLSPKVVEQSQSVTISTSGATDVSQGVIAGNSVSVSEDGKVSGNATGTKDVGDKAKGTVTIFNSDNAQHSLSAGTTITSPNGLNFTLDKDVTVASGSSDPTNLSAGTADVTVTASTIGTDYNLPSGTKFSITGTNVMAAKNSNAFSGGSKKTVTIVAQKDLDNLSSQLTQNLADKAKSDLVQQGNGDTVVLPDFTKTSITKQNADKKVGDEASSINLTGTVSYQTLSYKKSDFDSFTKSAMQDKIPSNMNVSSKGIFYEVKDLTVKDGNAKATLSMKAALLPQTDTKSLQNQIAGKSYAQAREILSSVPDFSDATFRLSPNLFFLPKALPRIGSNITISISTNE